MSDCDLTIRRNVHRSCKANAQKMLTSMAIAADTRYGIPARSVSAQSSPRMTRAPLGPPGLDDVRHARLEFGPETFEVPRIILTVTVEEQEERELFRVDRENRVADRAWIALAIRGRRHAEGWHRFRDFPKHLAGAISTSVLEYE